SVVTVRLENLRDGSRARWPVRAVTGPTTDQFGDRTESHRVMVPPRQQGSTRRRTKCRHVKSIVTKPFRRKFVERRRSDRPAEGRRIAEAGIVNQHEQNVRRIRWSFHGFCKRPFRSLECPIAYAVKRPRWTRQHRSIPLRIRSEAPRYLRRYCKC